jgi:CubicO group peptidase (beta-lactamase class C family)
VFRLIVCLAALFAAACSVNPPDLAEPPPQKPTFIPAEGQAETRDRISGLPDADVWINVTGEHMGWLHRNVNEVFPTVIVHRDGPVRELDYRLMDEVAQYPVPTPAGEMPFVDFLYDEQSTVMGMVILHRGSIVFEHYPRQKHYDKPIYWSTAKALVATLVAILEHRGLVDVGQPVQSYIPELMGTPFGGIRIRNVLDMAPGLDCPENYSDPKSCYYAYSQSVGEGYWNEESPEDPYEYVAGLEIGSFAEQGTSYEYSGINTFVLAWLVEAVSGMPLHDFFSREIWTKIGAEADGLWLAPRYGVPNPSGGFMSRIRDLARFGLLFTPSYRLATDEPIISERYLDTILYGGNPALLENARGAAPGEGRPAEVKHNVYQWDAVYTNNDFTKGGWGNQGLLINPDRDLVAVWTGYFKDDYSQVDPLPLLRAVLEGVFGGEQPAE